MAAGKHELSILTRVKDFASKALKSIGGEGKKSGASIAAGFVKAQLAIGGFKLAVRGVKNTLRDMTTELADQGDEFAKMSKRLGISIELLSGMKHAAELSGSSFQAVANGMKFLAKNAYDTSEGMGEALQAFKDLNVEVTGTDGKLRSLESLFPEVAGKIGAMENATKRAALAQRIFGRSALDLIPLMREGAGGIKAMIEEARRLGIVWTETEGKMAEAFVDAKLRLTRAIDGIKKAIGTELFPVLTAFAEKASKWLADNRDVIQKRAVEIMKSLGNALLDAAEMIARIFGGIEKGLRKLGLMDGPNAGKISALQEQRRTARYQIGRIGKSETPRLLAEIQRIDEEIESLENSNFGDRLADQVAKARRAFENFGSGGGVRTAIWGSHLTATDAFGPPGPPSGTSTDSMSGSGSSDWFGGQPPISQASLRRIKETNEELQESLDLSGAAASEGARGFTDFFDSITHGSQRAGAAFQAMAASVFRSLQRIAAHHLAEQFFSMAISGVSAMFATTTPDYVGSPSTDTFSGSGSGDFIGGGGGKAMVVTQNIYPTPGMSEADVADAVVRRMNESAGFRASVQAKVGGGL